MPKGVGYGEAAAKMGLFGKKKKKKDKKKTDRTQAVEKRLREAGLSDEQIRRLQGKKKG